MGIESDEDILSAREQMDRAAGVAKRLVRYWWVVAIAMFIGACAAVALFLIRKPLYLSECKILYREVIRSEVIYGQGQGRDRDDAATRLQETALARPRLETIIEDLQLFPQVRKDKGVDEAIEKMRKRIDFKAKGGDVFYIAFRGESPEQAFEVTEELAKNLIDEERRDRAEQVAATKDFLEKELDTARTDLSDSETVVAQFLDKHPGFALDTLNQSAPGAFYRAQQRTKESATPIQRKSKDPQLNSLYRDEARIATRIRDLERKGAKQELIAEKNRAENDLAEARKILQDRKRQYTERHPDVLAAEARFRSAERRAVRARDAVRRDIATTRAPQKRELDNQLSNVRQRIAARKAAIKRGDKKTDEPKAQKPTTEGEPETVVDIEVEWARLVRELSETRERYSTLESKFFRAEIDANSQIAAQASQMSIFEPAYVPNRPAGAGKKVILMAGVFGASLIGFAIALLLALMDDRLFERREVERLGILPVLVVVPKSKGKRKKRRAKTFD